jgi:hypothetical protein
VRSPVRLLSRLLFSLLECSRRRLAPVRSFFSTYHRSLTMTAAGVSPSSSPRLPSPPPFTEVQIGPQSPSVGESFGGDADLQLLGVSPGTDDGPTRRIRPGSKASEMSAGPPLIPLSQVSNK